MGSALETLCVQALGAKKYHMLGVYLQRSWLVLLLFAVALTPTYILMEDLLRLIGQSAELARLSGQMSICLIPQHFARAMMLPLTRFLQSQLKNWVPAVSAGVVLTVHVVAMYLSCSTGGSGPLGRWSPPTLHGGWSCWASSGASSAAGAPSRGKGSRLRLSPISGTSSSSPLLLESCLEIWYCRVLVLLTGYNKNAEIAIDALSICLTLNGWEMKIPLGFLAATGVRVANELGAGSGKGARFAIVVSIGTSITIGLVFWSVILAFKGRLALFFTSSKVVLDAVDNLSVLLAFTVLLNSVQPVLSGAAIGSGWQALVA